jgi:hypothetical protein
VRRMGGVRYLVTLGVESFDTSQELKMWIEKKLREDPLREVQVVEMEELD